MTWEYLLLMLVGLIIGVTSCLIWIKVNAKKNKPSDEQKNRIEKTVQTEGGSVVINGEIEKFNISVFVEGRNYIYEVKNGNIIGVILAESNKSYKYME